MEKSVFIAKKGPQLFAAIAATLGAFQMGLVFGWPSPGLPDLEERNDLGVITSDEISWIAAIPSLSCIFSVYPSGYAIQKFGRHPVMVYTSLPFAIGWLVIVFATNVNMLYIGRILTGFCSGVYSVAAPVFIAELSEPKIRGALGSLYQLLTVAGILLAYVIGAFVSWKWLAIVCIVPTVVCLAILIVTPESPRYLLTIGKYEEAKKSLQWYRGATDFYQVEEEYDIVKENVDNTMETSYRELLKPSILKPTSIGFMLMISQQLCGIDAVTVFTVSIFKDAGSSLDANWSSIIVGIVQVIFTLVAVVTVDKYGRRILLLSSNLFIVGALFGMGLFFFIQEEGEPVKHGWLPLTCMIIYISAYSLGIGPLAWSVIGEVLPNHIVGIAAPLATSMLWTLSFFTIRFFEPVQESLGEEAAFWFFSVATFLCTIYVYFFLPETKGKTLDEVQALFGDKEAAEKLKNEKPALA